MYKLDKLEQDISDVNGVLEDLEPYESYLDGKLKELSDKFSLLQEDLKYHLEIIKSFISDVR